MKVQCSKCESQYNIKDEKIPDAGAKIKCPKCQNAISVMKSEPEPPPLPVGDIQEDTKSELGPSAAQDVVPSETKKCSFCAELINVDAIKCKHCGSDLAKKKATSSPKKDSGELFGILMLCIPVVAAMLIYFWVGSSNMMGNSYNILMLIAVSTISITAILAAVEAHQLGFGKSKSGKKENGPIGLFFGIILMWAIGYPYYLYQRSKRGKKNLVAGGIFVTLLFTSSVFGMNLVMNGGMNSEISMVKNGTLSGYPNKTVGEAVEEFFGDPNWQAILGNDRNKYVNVTGSISYMQEEVRALMQFKLNVKNNSFEINALEFNGIPQNRLILTALLDKMYSP